VQHRPLGRPPTTSSTGLSYRERWRGAGESDGYRIRYWLRRMARELQKLRGSHARCEPAPLRQRRRIAETNICGYSGTHRLCSDPPRQTGRLYLDVVVNGSLAVPAASAVWREAPGDLQFLVNTRATGPLRGNRRPFLSEHQRAAEQPPGGALTVPTARIVWGRGAAAPLACGDGVFDPGEECDDGNAIETDLCNNQCQPYGGGCLSVD